MRRVAVTLAAGAGVLALAGCQGASISDVTLPGGATSKDVFGSKPTNNYVVEFKDALDLVPQSSVRMNDVDVGDVRSVTLDNGQARVTIRVLKSVTVPSNVQGVLSQTSLLGEKFVNLVIPNGDPASGVLPPGTVIPADKTSDELQVEDVFGALSELLNGGGLQQLQSISQDLSQLLTHRETSIRDLLSQFTTLAQSLDQRRTEIVNALDSLNKLALTLKTEQSTLKEALTDIAPGLKAIDQSRGDIINLLKSLNSLGTVATRVQSETQADTVSDLRTLQPTLDRLNQAGTSIVNSLELLVTYPFGDNALKAIFSDYTGLYATLDIDLRNGSTANPLGPTGLCGTVSSQLAQAPVDLCGLLGSLGDALPSSPTIPVPTTGTSTTSSPTPSKGPLGLIPSPSASPKSTTSVGGIVDGLVSGLTGVGK